MDKLTLHVQYGAARRNVPAVSSMRRWSELALADIEKPVELSVRVVGEKEGRELNHRWRSSNHATNVLSFGTVSPPGITPKVLGDVVLCAPVVLREAKKQGKNPKAHWAHLLLHGILHLLGYDHENDKDAAVMEAKEKQLLATLGFADPYTVAVQGR